MTIINDIKNNPEQQRIFNIILEEAARQWCDGLSSAPERADGEDFADFFYEIFEQKQQEYMELFSCENCMYYNTENWTCQNQNSPYYQQKCHCNHTCMEQEQ